MAWKLTQDPKNNILLLELSGRISRQQLIETTEAVATYQNGVEPLNILLDASDADVTTPLVDLFDLVDKTYAERGLDIRNKLALVLPVSTKSRKDAEFYQTVCINRGRIVEVFVDMDDALRWLIET